MKIGLRRPRPAFRVRAGTFLLAAVMWSMPASGQNGGGERPRAIEHFNELVRAAKHAVERGDREAALAFFHEALQRAPDEADELTAIVAFNAATLAFELGRNGQAEALYVTASRLSAALRKEALYRASIAAARAGRLDAAQRDLLRARSALGNALPRLDEEAAAITQELATRVRLQAAKASYDRGVLLARRGDFPGAQMALRDALARADDFTDTDRATIHVALAKVARELGDSAASDLHREAAFELDGDPEHLVDRGYERLARGDYRGAREDFLRVTDRELSPETRRDVERGRKAVFDLEPTGARGLLRVGGGLDTNAAQSGSSDAIGVATTLEAKKSPYLSIIGSVQYDQRVLDRLSVGAQMTSAWIALTAPSVSEQSFMQHGVTLSAYYALALDTVLGLRAGGRLSAVGVKNLSPFVADFPLAIELAQRLVRHREAKPSTVHWVTSGAVVPMKGLDGREWLDGLGLDGRTAVRFASRRLRAEAWAGYYVYGVGTTQITFAIVDLFHCAEGSENERCSRQQDASPAIYYIPLGYFSPRAGLRGSFQPHRRFQIEAQARFEYRQYLSESVAIPGGLPPPGAPEPPNGGPQVASRKLRKDFRWEGGIGGKWFLHESQAYGLYAEYLFLLSRSNMKREKPRQAEPTGPLETNYDYDNRNFAQHRLESGVFFRF